MQKKYDAIKKSLTFHNLIKLNADGEWNESYWDIFSIGILHCYNHDTIKYIEFDSLQTLQYYSIQLKGQNQNLCKWIDWNIRI